MSALSPLYPRGPINLGRRARPLPADGTLPGLPDWSWVPTPGHSPGHVAFFRESDRTLLAGDAFVTTRQESALAALAKWQTVWRPPAYYTCDWSAARESVKRLAALQPRLAATGHGLPLTGEQLTQGLRDLVQNWDQLVPSHGRYFDRPALTNEQGIVSLPPLNWSPYSAAAMVLGVAAAGVCLAKRNLRGNSSVANVISVTRRRSW